MLTDCEEALYAGSDSQTFFKDAHRKKGGSNQNCSVE
jgi:hypothetical protein